MAAAAAYALFMGALSLRTQGVYFIMITLAFAQMLYFLVVSLKAYGGDDGLPLAGRNTWAGIAPDDTALYYLALGALTLCLLLTQRLLNARFGQVLQGLRENPVRMQALARQFNLSETTFLLPPISSAAIRFRGRGWPSAFRAMPSPAKNSTSCARPMRSIWTRSARPDSMTRSGRPSPCCCRCAPWA